MRIKKIIVLFLFMVSYFALSAEEQKTTFKFYGFVRNDFFYNSRVNAQAIDGAFHIYPEPVIRDEHGKDLNAVPQAELLSIATRVGVDITGINMLGARSSAKIEADFAGFGGNYYVLRIRQAYVRLNWKNSELLLGQTWHPMFGSVMPTMMSLNAGSPFQPFNRSPQLRFKYNLGSAFSLTAAALYQMQYTSYGPSANAHQMASASFLKNAIMPNLFLGFEHATSYWTSGAGVDMKMIKPDREKITSVSAVAYTQYVKSKLQVKAKAIWGENLSDHLMLSGYGVSGVDAEGNPDEYTNFNILSSWVNISYGTRWRVGVFAGLSQNFGTNKYLVPAQTGFIYYGRGIYPEQQILIDQLYRIAPHVSYNLSKLSFGLEYDFTSAVFGQVNYKGRVDDSYSVYNHRLVFSAVYSF